MDRRTCSPWMASILLVLTCLSVWQMMGCPGPPNSVYVTTPVYTLLSASNYTYNVYSKNMLPQSDFSVLINIPNFRFTIFSKVCGMNDTIGEYPFLLVLVHSAPSNTAKRKTIRETWGEKRDKMKLVFMFGEVDTPQQQNQLEEEHMVHGDIVQGSFHDAYRNMTYKHVMALKYAVYFCSQARYIMKVDDDIFVNMPNLIAFLTKDLSEWGARNLVLCQPTLNSMARRSYRSKWRVSFKEFPHKYYPTYCQGWAIIYSPDVVFRLYHEAQQSEYFWIDDVHITGILAKRLNLVLTPITDFILSEEQTYVFLKKNGSNVGTSSEMFLFGSLDLKQDVFFKLWSLLRNKTKHHSNYKIS